MQKDFDSWNTIKKRVNGLHTAPQYFKEREIWWFHLGLNIGHEQDGKGPDLRRPALIFKKFSSNTCWVIPLSTRLKKGKNFFYLLSQSNTIRTAPLHQIRLLDTHRLIKKLDKISKQEHILIKEKLTALIQ